MSRGLAVHQADENHATGKDTRPAHAGRPLPLHFRNKEMKKTFDTLLDVMLYVCLILLILSCIKVRITFDEVTVIRIPVDQEYTAERI